MHVVRDASQMPDCQDVYITLRLGYTSQGYIIQSGLKCCTWTPGCSSTREWVANVNADCNKVAFALILVPVNVLIISFKVCRIEMRKASATLSLT